NGRRELRYSGPSRLSHLRRLEALGVRRPQSARAGFDPFLHQDQDHHLALAVRHQRRRRVRDPDDEMSLMRGAATVRWPSATALAFALAACTGTLPGVENKPAKPKIEMSGRRLLAANNAPACGMSFTVAADGQSGNIRPEGGCPGDLFTSRQWAFACGELVLNNPKGEHPQ